MNVALWIVTGLLAVGYLAGGLAMVLMSKDRFRNLSNGQHYADDFSAGMITTIGVLKLVAVAGLLLPPLLGVAPQLVPLAALGLVLLMTGAATVRIVRHEWPHFLGDLVFFALAAFVAWGRFFVAPLS
ncbi:DoxX family protein [Pseudactinotalea sp.]|uniref:DoxX family protein n=1 Tax=Pseudactinotalea sp. TaxID=1926260 RepID=UPI003B3B5A8C